MAIITAIVNQKGGVGKTTTAINLSACLTQMGYRVLLIDLDPQANTTKSLGIDPTALTLTIYEVLVSRENVNEAITKTKINGLDLVPSHLKLDRAELALAMGNFKEQKLYKAISVLDYDFIIVDCRPTLQSLTVNALYAANYILVPCEVSKYSLDGFSDLMETIRDIKNGNSQKVNDFVRIFLTKFDVRNSVTNDWMMKQLESYQPLLFETKIRDNQALNQAHIAEQSIFSFDPKSNGALDYQSLTKEFLSLCQAKENF